MAIKHIKSLEKGLNILQTFTPLCPTLPLRELTKRVKLPKATVFRLVRTLTSLGYISYDPESKHYMLSPRVMLLGFTALSGMDLINVAHPYLTKLSEATDQNVNLGILSGTEVVYIDRVARRKMILDVHVGSTVTVYRSAIGGALLAFLSQKELDAVMKEILKDAEAAACIGTGGERLVERFEEIRQKGYELCDEDFIRGLRAVAAPIFTKEGRVEAAVNIVALSNDVSREQLIDRFVPLLLDTTEKVSAARGFLKYALEKGAFS